MTSGKREPARKQRRPSQRVVAAPAADSAPEAPIEKPLPLGLLLSAALRAWYGAVADNLKEAGYADLSPSMGIVFENIGRNGTRIQDLAEMAAVSKQAVAQVVDLLERAGYVEKAPDPQDGRAKLVILSARGKDAARKTKQLMREQEESWARQIGEQQHAALVSALQALLRSQGRGAQPGQNGSPRASIARSD